MRFPIPCLAALLACLVLSPYVMRAQNAADSLPHTHIETTPGAVAQHARITRYRALLDGGDSVTIPSYGPVRMPSHDLRSAANASGRTSAAHNFSTLMLGGDGGDGIGAILQINDTIVYLLSATTSSNLCDTTRGYQSVYRGAYEAVIATYNPRNNELTYLTYLGGSNNDEPIHMFLINNKLVFLFNTNSTDLPTTPEAVKRTFSGEYDLYIAVLDLTCSTLLYATYLGGTGIDIIEDARIDDNGTISMVGFTDSRSRFPITANARQKQYGGGEDDAFITQFCIDPFRIVYSSYYGGDGYDEARTVAMSPYNAVSLAGLTSSTNLAVTPNAVQSTYIAESSGFIVVYDSLFTQTRYSTYFGGDHWGWFEGSAFSSSGLAVYCAETGTDSLPTAPSAFQRIRTGIGENNNGDLYVFVLDTTFQQIASTYYGGKRAEIPVCMDVIEDEIYVAGYAFGTSSPITYRTDCTDDRHTNALITVLSLDCTTLKFGCFFGGDSADWINTLQRINGGVWFGGCTYPKKFTGLGEWRGGEPNGLTQAFLVMSEGSITSIFQTPPAPRDDEGRISVRVQRQMPQSSRYTVFLQSNTPQRVEYVLTTLDGRELVRHVADIGAVGRYIGTFDLAGFPRGMYLLTGWSMSGGFFEKVGH